MCEIGRDREGRVDVREEGIGKGLRGDQLHVMINIDGVYIVPLNTSISSLFYFRRSTALECTSKPWRCIEDTDGH